MLEKVIDHQARRRFVKWAQNEIAVVPDFHKQIFFSDEAHFWLNGYVNKQNCRIWSEDNPQVYVKTPLHPEKMTVWCALWAGGIIGPYFFKNDDGQNVTVNGDRYRAMITNIFIPELNNHDVQELWFQQDGATCHGHRSNSCARWRIDSFGSSAMLHSTVAIASSVRTVRRLWGCELSIRVNVVRKRSMVNRINCSDG